MTGHPFLRDRLACWVERVGRRIGAWIRFVGKRKGQRPRR